MEDSGIYAMSANLEHVFLLIYIFEMCLHLIARGRACLRNAWVKFDFVLIIMGVFGSWIAGPALGGGQSEVIANVMLFRTVRLLRFVRALRLFKAFSGLFKLV